MFGHRLFSAKYMYDNLMHHNNSDTPWIIKRQFPNFGHKNACGQSRIFNEIQHQTHSVAIFTDVLIDEAIF